MSKQQKCIFSHFWRLKSEIKGSADLIPSEGCEKESASCLSPSSWWFAGSLWCFSSCRHIPLLCLHLHVILPPCVCMQIVPVYKDTIHPIPVWRPLNYICNDLFPNQVTLEVRTLRYGFWGKGHEFPPPKTHNG